MKNHMFSCEFFKLGPFTVCINFENDELRKEVTSLFKENWPVISVYQITPNVVDCYCHVFISERYYKDYIEKTPKDNTSYCYAADNRLLTYSSDFKLIRYFINTTSNYIAYILDFIGKLFIFSPFLLRHNSLMLHAAGVVYKNKGFIFAGPAGIGKTTICKILCRGGAYPLSDDRVIVRNEGGKFTVYPLWIFSSDGMDLSYEFMKLQFHSFPLKAIFFLQQSKKFALKEMNFLDKISMISKNSLLFSENIRDSREDFFLSVHSISKNKHIYKLCYDRSDKIFPLLDSYDE